MKRTNALPLGFRQWRKGHPTEAFVFWETEARIWIGQEERNVEDDTKEGFIEDIKVRSVPDLWKKNYMPAITTTSRNPG